MSFKFFDMKSANRFPGFDVLSAKILLTTLLFFSFFTITGYNDNSNKHLYQKTQTELTYSTNKITHPNTWLYQNFLIQKFSNNLFYTSQQYKAIALLHYNRLEKIKFQVVLKKQHHLKIPNNFIQFKTISCNSDETISLL